MYNGKSNKATYNVVSKLENDERLYRRYVMQRQEEGSFTESTAKAFVERVLGKQPKDVNYAEVASSLND